MVQKNSFVLFGFRSFFVFSKKGRKEKMIRPLLEMDLPQVEFLDELSGNCVQQWIEEEGEIDAENAYAWGYFKWDRLIGYCTIGGADDVAAAEQCKEYSSDSLLLSDVYILPDYRHKGYGTELVNTSINFRTRKHKESVFLTLLHDDLCKFYRKVGFDWATDKHEYLMVRKGEEK